ncbi:MAG TPA: hypothetical protein VNE41_10885 [Chitinophagaceae bacterium]|nr:hypothetical protein [Chitinophagaceae bacterium]
MNKENLQYLQNTVKFLGFEESLLSEMQRQMKEDAPEFQLKATGHFNRDEVGALLYFRKSEKTDFYFFNKFDLVVLHDKEPEKDRSQTFFIHGGSGVTFKEAYNLLEGRAVYKTLLDQEGKKYQAWMQLDFSKVDANGNYRLRYFYSSYGYDLERTLSAFPIRELGNEDEKEMLIISLNRGNRQLVSFLTAGREQRMYIEAAPQFKSLNVYDGALTRVRQAFRPDIGKENSPAADGASTGDGAGGNLPG